MTVPPGSTCRPQQRRAGYLFQQYALFPNMTVRQNIAAAVPNRRERSVQTEELLRRFQLEEVASQRPWQLSGGQQQRCAWPGSWPSAPRVILLDEPFSALDSYLQDQMEVELAQTLEQFSGPVVWVSHDRGEVFRNCPQVCVIDRGTSQPVTSLEELFRNPAQRRPPACPAVRPVSAPFPAAMLSHCRIGG